MKRFILLTILLVVFISIIIPSCSRREDFFNHSSRFKDYLSLSSNNLPLHQFSSEDILIFSEALSRFGLYIQDERLCYRLSSAEEGYMSVQLYNLIVSMIDRTEPGSFQTRSGTPSDCVARALSMWGVFDYDTINFYATQLYGNDGIPPGSLLGFIRHFYPTTQQFCPDSIDVSTFSPDAMTTVGYFPTNDPLVYHMVNIGHIDSVGVTTCIDFQNAAVYQKAITDYIMIFQK